MAKKQPAAAPAKNVAPEDAGPENGGKGKPPKRRATVRKDLPKSGGSFCRDRHGALVKKGG